jgi:L-lysine 2,3-aminomutase
VWSIVRYRTFSEQAKPLNDWQKILSQALNSTATLSKHLKTPQSEIDPSPQFPLRLPIPMLDRIQSTHANDPVLRQFLPTQQEQQDSVGFVHDPLEEARFSPLNGLLHKYPGRALIIMTSVCAVHCRYCFRRHYPYAEQVPDSQQWAKLLDHIRQDTSINEIILSGGDPLSLGDDKLRQRCLSLSTIPQIKTLRIHSRLPVIIPERITPALLQWMEPFPLPIVLVTHINHPNEINPAVIEAMHLLQKAGVHLLNQSVLLKQVNDNTSTLKSLSERLFSAHILPYYLHQLDTVSGTAHFSVDDQRARTLIDELRACLPGYLVPKLVRETPGDLAKMPV